MANGKLQDVELFLFTDNMVFESVFYKETPKIYLLFELVIRLYQGTDESIFDPARYSYRGNKNY